MKWTITNPEPLTTESQRAVTCEDGRQGWVSVRCRNGRPELYGSVFDRPRPEPSETALILDMNPTL